MSLARKGGEQPGCMLRGPASSTMPNLQQKSNHSTNLLPHFSGRMDSRPTTISALPQLGNSCRITEALLHKNLLGQVREHVLAQMQQPRRRRQRVKQSPVTPKSQHNPWSTVRNNEDAPGQRMAERIARWRKDTLQRRTTTSNTRRARFRN